MFQIYAGYKLRTYLMGFTYDSQEDELESTDFQYQVMNFSLRQLKQRNWLRRKAALKEEQGEAYQEQKPSAAQAKPQNDEYGAEEFKKGDDKDDYGVEDFM